MAGKRTIVRSPLNLLYYVGFYTTINTVTSVHWMGVFLSIFLIRLVAHCVRLFMDSLHFLVHVLPSLSIFRGPYKDYKKRHIRKDLLAREQDYEANSWFRSRKGHIDVLMRVPKILDITYLPFNVLLNCI